MKMKFNGVIANQIRCRIKNVKASLIKKQKLLIALEKELKKYSKKK